MAVYAYCHYCKKSHRKGTKIFQEHKESLGMYTEKLRRTPSHIKQYWDMRRKGELNPGAAWHRAEADIDKSLRDSKARSSHDWTYYDGRYQSDLNAAHSSDYRGIPNPTQKKSGTLLTLAVLAGLGYLLYKNRG